MINRQQLLSDLKPLLKEMEADLRARCDEVPQIDADLKAEYEQARAADRTGVTYEQWRADLITQVAVAWVLSSVFVRFLEDNALISPPRISGPLHGAGTDAGLQRARDERETFFKTHARETDREYLLTVFDDLAKLSGTKDVFGAHNVTLAYRNWLSGDAAQKLIEFFQRIDTDGTGEILHDFTDANWDTRFLGDLYQDLSEAARKKYALLQTPIFVEEFILDRTLEPAINEFGLKDFKMIDPACGSGHFLLGSFARILKHWRSKEPGTNGRELVTRALSAVHGVDLNPYAVAIARFRLLIAAMRECHITNLKDAPAFAFNLACGDSLLHGKAMQQSLMDFHELAHAYQSEDLPELQRILAPGTYHAVVANPPYITVKDKALNQAYRERYPQVCHRQYSLSVPFLQRLFVLACDGGFTGQITANSFMKREFGKKLIESYLPRIDLTHVIDTSGAYIPGHGTPTVILFGRNRKPVAPAIRAVMGIKGEPATPADPAHGLVWTAITQQIDQSGSQSAFVSVNDTPREQFGKHPWSIGGGGAAELKEFLEGGRTKLNAFNEEIGRTTVVGEDDAWIMDSASAARLRIANRCIPLVIGECVRDYSLFDLPAVLYPYMRIAGEPIAGTEHAVARYLSPFRTLLSGRSVFGKTMADNGRHWWEHLEHYTDKLRTPLSIVFGFVATHNHFVLDPGGKVFNRSAPVIKLPATATEDDHLGLLGILNSSVACFWMQQTMHNKGGPGGGSSKDEKWHDFYEFSGTQLQTFPLPASRPLALARQLDSAAQQLGALTPAAVVLEGVPTLSLLDQARQTFIHTRERMIAIQEELDWQCYGLYGLIDEPPVLRADLLPNLALGQRAFEIVLARKMATDEIQSKWFEWLEIQPITEIPQDWPADYRAVVQQRIELIETDANIALIERQDCKRRWETESWDAQQERALRGWLLDRLESSFDLDGRMNDGGTVTAANDLHQPCLISVAKVADLARADREFMAVAEIYSGRMDFDVGALVGELMTAESVPALSVLRYKPAAMDKRAAWERTWELQREEDRITAQIDTLQGEWKEAEKAGKPTAAIQSNIENLKSKMPRIPVPPKYSSADFFSSACWRLRGKLDVPKERWVSFPHCEGEDGSLVIAWAGYDHLQLAQAIAGRYELAKENEGRKLVPLLTAIGGLIPWLKQWHNELDPKYGAHMGDYFAGYLAEEAKAIGMSVEDVMGWVAVVKVKGRGKKKAEVE